MSRLEQLADLMERGALTDGDRRDIAALLRAASAETVGREWATTTTHSYDHNADLHAALASAAECSKNNTGLADALRSAQLEGIRLRTTDCVGSDYIRCEAAKLHRLLTGNESNSHAIDHITVAYAHAERLIASLAEKQRAIDEAFAVLDAGHGMLACREAAHILRPHATKATEAAEENLSAALIGATPRQWTSTPPKDRSRKWWNAYGVSAAHAHYRHIIPDECSWDNATHLVAESDYDLWLPWQEGDTADNLPPLPTERHAPLNLPADRAKMIERACEADDGACSTGSTPATADDTRELVARLALAVRNDAVERCNPELEAACDAIIADARRGGGA